MTKKKTTSSEQPDSLKEITSIVCQLKHEAIDKEFENIKNDIKTSNINLKDKIVLVEKTIGDKIDSLSDFDDTLKGNGTPGIRESVRNIKRDVRIIIALLVIFIGGSVSGVSLKTIKEKIFGQKTEQVEPTIKKIEIPKKEVKLFVMPKD